VRSTGASSTRALTTQALRWRHPSSLAPLVAHALQTRRASALRGGHA
jgi:hypothetical protein